MEKSTRDARIEGNGKETLLYANDVVVMANYRPGIQDVTTRWWHGMNENGMKINTHKGKSTPRSYKRRFWLSPGIADKYVKWASDKKQYIRSGGKCRSDEPAGSIN